MPVLVPKIQKLVQAEKEKIIREQVTSWLMGFATGKLETQYFNKKKISYSGTGFEGSPRHVFWGRYIEPFLEDVTDRLIAEVSNECSENNLNFEEELRVLSDHLKGMYARIFDEMAKVDQKILGQGFPERITKKNVSREVADMNSYLEQHINMEIAKYKSRLRTTISDDFDELKDPKHENRIKYWVKYGYQAIEQDLINGGTDLVGGTPQVRDLAWKWVRQQKQQIAIPTYAPQKQRTFLQKLWHDPVWSKVIGASIIGLALYIWDSYGDALTAILKAISFL